MSVQSPTSSDEDGGPRVKRKRTDSTRPMVTKACVICARKKARCSGGEPCEGCIKHGNTCAYNPVRRRGPKVKSRPPIDPPGSFSVVDLHPDDARPLHPFPPPQQPPETRHLHHAMHASSAHRDPRHSDLSPSNESSDSGSLVTDRVLQAEGPGIQHYMNILPRDMATNESQPYPVTSTEGRVNDANNHWQTPTPDIRASDLDLAKLADNPDVIKGLYCIYWCFVHPSWPVIYRPSYDQLNAPKRYPLLHNAVMSCCCRLDLNRQTRDMPLESRIPLLSAESVRAIGDFFFHRAERHLQKIEAGGGDLNTVQALLVMTIRELGQNKLGSGWAYSGQALRLAQYLSLHSEGGQSSNVVFKEEEKRRVIWQCYVVDKYISIMMGKPFMLRREIIETPLPSTTESDEYAMWDTDARMVIPGIASRFDGVRCLTVSNFIAWVRLTMIIEKILDGIPTNSRRVEQKQGNSVKELDEALVVWLKQAGENYVETATLSVPPHMLLLKLWYYCCLILVHRRHIKDTTTFNRNGKATASHTICIDAANGICETVRVMEASYGLYRFPSAVVFIIFQAGIIHLSNSAAADSRASRHGRDSLGQCIWWLDQIAGTYGISPAYCSVLSRLKELSERELRNHHEVEAILASRRGSRNNSPTADLGTIPNGRFPEDLDHNNRIVVQSTQRYNLPKPDEMPDHGGALAYNPFDASSTTFTFDTSRSLDDSTVFPDISSLYGHLHETFFSEMPINLPSSTDDMSNWNMFQADYEALLHNQPYGSNQPG